MHASVYKSGCSKSRARRHASPRGTCAPPAHLRGAARGPPWRRAARGAPKRCTGRGGIFAISGGCSVGDCHDLPAGVVFPTDSLIAPTSTVASTGGHPCRRDGVPHVGTKFLAVGEHFIRPSDRSAAVADLRVGALSCRLRPQTAHRSLGALPGLLQLQARARGPTTRPQHATRCCRHLEPSR